MDPPIRAAKKNTSHGNEVLPQDTRHLIQRPRYQRGSLSQDLAGAHEDLLTMLRRRRLKWYGHVSGRSSGLTKIILQSTVKWGGIQGRQKKRWEDNIGKWTDLEFAKSQRAGIWRKLIMRSYVVPQRPPLLRDRWRWNEDFMSFKDALPDYCHCRYTSF